VKEAMKYVLWQDSGHFAFLIEGNFGDNFRKNPKTGSA